MCRHMAPRSPDRVWDAGIFMPGRAAPSPRCVFFRICVAAVRCRAVTFNHGESKKLRDLSQAWELEDGPTHKAGKPSKWRAEISRLCGECVTFMQSSHFFFFFSMSWFCSKARASLAAPWKHCSCIALTTNSYSLMNCGGIKSLSKQSNAIRQLFMYHSVWMQGP